MRRESVHNIKSHNWANTDTMNGAGQVEVNENRVTVHTGANVLVRVTPNANTKDKSKEVGFSTNPIQ